MKVKIVIGDAWVKIAAMKKAALTAASEQALGDCNQYVPEDSTALSGSSQAASDVPNGHLVWQEEYAHYQHEGIVWASNNTIYEGGSLAGFYSPPVKHPTGRRLRYKKAGARAKWTMVAYEAHGDDWRKAAEKAMGKV